MSENPEVWHDHKEKLEHGEKVIEAQRRIAVSRRQLLHYGQVDGR